MKKAYESPELIVRGTIEEITHGSGWGISDMLIGDGADTGGCWKNGRLTRDCDILDGS